MAYSFSRNLLSGEFFTLGTRISCQFSVPVGGLNALLVDPLHSHLELEDAYISRINTPGEIVAHYESAAIRKDNIIFILMNRVEEGSVPKGSGGFVRPVFKEAFVVIPSFEITGQVEMEPNASPRDVLVQSIGRFMPIMDATARVTQYPKIEFGGKLLLINKDRIETLCIG
jgi:hypothetical protein